jgi:RNA 2',3'-cyclic 3'-phosphodiesterase
VRLFTALWVPPAAAAGLRALTSAGPVPAGWRAVDPDSWHLTLAFHGEADPGPLVDALDRAARDLPAPRLRLHGAGEFPNVRWAGVLAEPAERLHDLVAAASGEPATFVPHVTVWRRGGRAARREPGPRSGWSGHQGPWWRPADVVLVRSDTGRDGPRYQVVHRTRLGSG